MTAFRTKTNIATVVRPRGSITRSINSVRGISTSGNSVRDAAAVLVPSGNSHLLQWQAVPGATSYDVEVLRVNNDGTEMSAGTFNVISRQFTFMATKTGSYVVRVRARNAGGPFAWSRSDNPAFATVNGAARGWWVLVYVAPVSGGGIR